MKTILAFSFLLTSVAFAAQIDCVNSGLQVTIKLDAANRRTMEVRDLVSPAIKVDVEDTKQLSGNRTSLINLKNGFNLTLAPINRTDTRFIYKATFKQPGKETANLKCTRI